MIICFPLHRHVLQLNETSHRVQSTLVANHSVDWNRNRKEISELSMPVRSGNSGEFTEHRAVQRHENRNQQHNWFNSIACSQSIQKLNCANNSRWLIDGFHSAGLVSIHAESTRTTSTGNEKIDADLRLVRCCETESRCCDLHRRRRTCSRIILHGRRGLIASN